MSLTRRDFLSSAVLLPALLPQTSTTRLVGAVPLVGDAFDVMFRANKRNMKLLREHFEKEGLN